MRCITVTIVLILKINLLFALNIEEQKIYGLKNIRVIDASIMPTMLSANLHSGATLIGEKGSDLVLGKEPLMSADLKY